MASERLLTRKDVVELLRSTYGLPVTINTFQCGDKKLTPCDERTPQAPPRPVMTYGRTSLYRAGDAHDWAARIIKARTAG